MDIYNDPSGAIAVEWPYKVNYGKEYEISTDVLVLGGGLAGCQAAINARKKGVEVAIVDKAPIIRSGSGGAGIDHWHDVFANPCSRITPEQAMELQAGQLSSRGGFEHLAYITCKESYDALLDVEQMGLPIRDLDDEFKGAEFRDEETKLLFAYDYKNKHTIRLRAGAELKVVLHKELKRLDVDMHEHIMVTSLLTHDGESGSSVVGATGINTRTGEFYIFKSKVTVMAMSMPSRLWIFNTELSGSYSEHMDPNLSGDGYAMAWKVGAKFTGLEVSGPNAGPFAYPAYGTGFAHNTWYACNLVDDNGKEIPWVDRDGKELKTIEERYQPAPGQKLFTVGPPGPYELEEAYILPDIADRIRNGEFKLPFYADLPSMSEKERRALFGLMVANEGKTRIPVYENYTQAGFDPDKDMLQVAIVPPERTGTSWLGYGPPQWRSGGGTFVVDWDLKTNIEGLYAATGGGCAGASSCGRYIGRNAAVYSKTAADPVVDRGQIDDEKARVYAPVKRKDGIGWKELQAGACRIMQDYCGEYKSKEILETGLYWLDSIEESEGSMAYARNPHELWRTLEVFSRITVGKMIMHASLARKASSQRMNFKRLDYPDMDPSAWDKYITLRQEKGEIRVGELPRNFWLQAPYVATYEENYDRNCCL